ncbi:MAG: DNA repair protein RecN [Planctomycetota bacterium]
MLAEFHLRNFVLIEDGTLRFGPGFNVIPGETGAGKSLVATALGIALGRDRFETRHIRKDAETATLTAVFDLPAASARDLAARYELDPEDLEEGLVIERRTSREGRGRITVAGRPTPLSRLRDLGRELIDIAAQGEATALREPARQRELLDRFGGLDADADTVASAHRTLRELVEEQAGGEARRRARREELERVRHHIAELEAIEPDPDGDAEPGARIAFLQHAARIRDFCAEAEDALYERDDAVVSRIGHFAREANDLGEAAPALADAAGHFDAAVGALDEAVRLLRDLAADTDVDEGELDRVAERREALRDLARKHGCDPTELRDVLDALAAREAELSARDADAAQLGPAIESAAAAYRAAALGLRAARERAGRKLAKEVKRRLGRLGMEQADFAVRQTPLVPDDASPAALARDAGAAGLDTVAFALRPNPGEAWGDLETTASGGETTRALLAVKAALSAQQRADVLFFDEIDAGVGGRLAAEIAEELVRLAGDRQVIAITHLPGIAARGATHLRVRKETTGKRTHTRIDPLDDDARVEEIAGMIRGSRSNATTLQQAREMLESGA